jgi:hypothetical protein
VTWHDAAAWAAAPLAFVLELVAARCAVIRRPDLAEAWLCAGARPMEVLARLRGRVRPAIVLAAALVLPAIVRPAPVPTRPVLFGLAGIAVASLMASIVASLRLFVDSRLLDRVPPEARTPFRLKPYEPPASLEVYETRPPEDGSP